MKMNHIKSQTNINKYWDLYQQAVKNRQSPGIILKIAEQFDICPCLIAKLILQKYFEDLNLIEQINNYLRDTSLIPDAELSYEVFLVSVTFLWEYKKYLHVQWRARNFAHIGHFTDLIFLK
jgi:hypothetical protein